MPQFPNYMPILKTTPAELHGIENLDSTTKSEILPLFELTKSRRSSKVPHGDIFRTIEKLKTVYNDDPFILDLTAHDDLQNPQITNLLNEKDGFANWRGFLNDLDIEHIIPIVHAIEGGDLRNVETEAHSLENEFGTVAFRVDAFDTETPQYIAAILSGLSSALNLIIVIDSGFIRLGYSESYAEEIIDRINEIEDLASPALYYFAASGFPRAVGVAEYGNDETGIFPIEEVQLHQVIQQNDVPENVCYGDYASVHPERYPTRGGTWIPRVDYPLEDQYFYFRYRRDMGGYEKAAAQVIDADEFDEIDCWGTDKIKDAASGNVYGRSPTSWISVRINIHISRQITRIGE